MKSRPAKPRWAYLVRHAEAVAAEVFEGPDLERPLTRAGRKSAARAYRRLARTLKEPPELVVCSLALRARETADQLRRAFPGAALVETSLLNPGARPAAIRRVLQREGARRAAIALVGHEPDFSQAVGELTGGGPLRLRLRKGAVVALEASPRGWMLSGLYDAKVLEARKGGRRGKTGPPA